MSEPQIITGFAAFDIQEHYLYFLTEDRPAKETLVESMPLELAVYLNGGNDPVMIPVNWYDISADYEESNECYYQFSPAWDPDQYVLSENIDLWSEAPYIGVFLDQDTSDEVKLTTSTVSGNNNEILVYNYLINTMRVTPAVACGIMANIQCESNFMSNATFLEGNGLTSYGICQWNGERLAALKAREGDKYTTLTGQLDYLFYELAHSEKTAWKKVQACENTATGAHNAGYNWAKYFERCAEYYRGVAQYIQRANLARDKYWPAYGQYGTAKTAFSDVYDNSDFFYPYVYWAADAGIVSGWTDGTFRPYNNCNRAAVVTFLWRLGGRQEAEKIASFLDMPADTPENSDFRKAISWAYEQGIVEGWDDNTFHPWETCNRAAIVTFLWRYAEKPTAESQTSFKDMTGNTEFDQAITWAASKGITTGWDDNTFRPWSTCKRLAIVSFLYRYANQ